MAFITSKTLFSLFKLIQSNTKNINTDLVRNLSNTKASKLIYSEYGDPLKVVEKVDEILYPNLKINDVLVKMIAAPVNPADINTIQGKYPVKPPLPSVPGNEGVGEVVSVGSQVRNLKEGDRVILVTNACGTWQSHVIVPQNALYPVPKKLGIVEACTLTVNPCTAYRLLRDYVSLKPGDTVIQNGANSSAGQNIIQIARVWGFKTVNVVRNRPSISELKSFLTSIGASHILTEEELRTTDLFSSGKLKKPRLAINCVGGQSSLELVRHLEHGGTLVTFGGMSREPVTIPTGSLIFKDITLKGFWMTAWAQKHANSPERKEMFEELVSMMTNGELHGPAYTMVPLTNYKEALINTMTIKGMVGRKYIIDFQ